MKDTFILAPGANGTELLRTLALFGKNTWSVRIENACVLAENALTKNGIWNTKRYVNAREQGAIIRSILREDSIFQNSINDCIKLSRAIDSARQLIEADEQNAMSSALLNNAEFPEKNTEIFQVYCDYISYLENNDLIDGIGLIHLAIENNCKLDFDFVTFTEFPLTPLEQCLLDTVSGGKYTSVSLCDYAKPQSNESPLSIQSFTKAYGSLNEAYSILDTIYKKGYPLDLCTIAVTDAKEYSQLFYSLSNIFNIPMSFGTGLPVSNTNPARLLKLLFVWNEQKFNATQPLVDIINSPAFDKAKLIENCSGQITDESKKSAYRTFDNAVIVAGRLKLSFSAVDNRIKFDEYMSEIRKEIICCEDEKELSKLKTKREELIVAKEIFDEFENGYRYIIDTYSKICSKADSSAKNLICRILPIYAQKANETGVTELGDISEILEMMIQRENRQSGKLHIVSINSAICSLCENLFVAGLSADKFPGSPKENYIFLDNDYNAFGYENASSKNIEKNRAILESLLAFANRCKANVFVSWSDYSLADIKDKNRSSVVYELMERVGVTDAQIKSAEFFESDIDTNRGYGVAYNNEIIHVPDTYVPSLSYILPKDKVFSPSKIETFLDCQKKFYYEAVLGLSAPDEIDDENVLDSREFGTYVHKVLEAYGEQTVSDDEIMQYAEELFDVAVKSKKLAIAGGIESEKQDFLSAVENGLSMVDWSRKAVASEQKISILHEKSGITIVGIPDRVETDEDGNAYIVDYKTGRKNNHVSNDIKSCIQVALYAYMLSNRKENPLNVVEGVYHYIRLNQSESLQYGEGVSQEIDKILCEMSAVIDSGEYELPEKSKACGFCKFAHLCGKEDKK